jgi:hypothetical protein
VVVVFLVGAVALSVVTNGQRAVWKWGLSVIGGCSYAAFLTFLCFAVRRFEARQRRQNIERYRCELPVEESVHARR